MPYKIEDIWNEINSAIGAEKVAEDATLTESNRPITGATSATSATSGPLTVKTAEAELLKAISALSEATEKTASENPQVSDLMKIAKDLNDQEFDGLLKKADVLASAIADGIVSRLQMYEKIAAEQAIAQATAEENLRTKVAAQVGYNQTRNIIEKVAAASFEEGFFKTAEVIAHATMFDAGNKVANDLLAIVA